MRVRTTVVFGALLISVAASPALAGDTVSYSYDALGRLVTTTVSGGPNSGVTAGTAFDPAGNRTGYTVSGAASSRAASAPNSSSTAQKPQQPVPVFKLDDK